MNSVHIVGTLLSKPKQVNTKRADAATVIEVGALTNFRMGDGDYKVDTLPVRLWRGMSAEMFDFCNIGQLISLRGRFEVEDGVVSIVAEHVEVLHSVI